MKAGYYKGLRVKYPVQPATPSQYILDLGIEVQRDVNGIEMGVLENGIPFLTQRGVAKISGAARSVIFDVTQEWEKHYQKPHDPGTTRDSGVNGSQLRRTEVVRGHPRASKRVDRRG